MIVCEFCSHFTKAGTCAIGLDIRKGMTCREFKPEIEKFCADPKDFVGSSQIAQMAAYFGFQKVELRKVKLMAAREESERAKDILNLEIG